MRNKPGHAIRSVSRARMQTYSPNHWRESLEESVDAQISEYIEELQDWEETQRDSINSAFRRRGDDG